MRRSRNYPVTCSCWTRCNFLGVFLTYHVRFDALCVLAVHAKAYGETNFGRNGPMDTISVKRCATVAFMCQKQNNTAFRRSPQLALQADCWTGYLSLARTKPLSNHNMVHCPCCVILRVWHSREQRRG